MLNDGVYIPYDDNKKGVLRTFRSHLTLQCSQAESGECSNAFGNGSRDPNNLWKSISDPNAFYEVKIKDGYFYPTTGVILSCYSSACLYNFTIYGIEKDKSNYSEICSFAAESTYYFKGKVTKYPCPYDKPLQAVKIKQNGPNASGDRRILLYVFDFYGYTNLSSHTRCHLLLQWKSNLIYIFVLLLK